jgi:hypothetical protein
MAFSSRDGLGAAIAGAVAIAALSTLGDAVWFELRLRHRPLYGLAHGVLLFLAIGLFLGVLRRRPWSGAAGGAAIGLLSAGGYYLLAPFTGPAAMFVIWMLLWGALAALEQALAGPAWDRRAIAVRGGLAAVLSGIAFYAISGIWTSRPAGGRNYAVHFASWTIAYLPAFLAILCRRPSRGAEQPPSG